MTCLRKITSLRRIVMVTTLTKQSVRAILELARPIEGGLGHPFMPVRACIVDTLPTGPHFEAVILMERRLMHRLTQPWFIKMLEEESKSLDNTRANIEKIINNDVIEVDTQLIKNPLAKTAVEQDSKPVVVKKPSPVKSEPKSPKGKAKLKRDHLADSTEVPKKIPKKFGNPGPSSWQQGKFHANPKKNYVTLSNVRLTVGSFFSFINQIPQLRKRIGFTKTLRSVSIRCSIRKIKKRSI